MDRKGEVEMDFLQVVKNSYQFRKVEKVDDVTIQTEYGRKKVYFWNDRSLLDWHIAWRDYCSVQGQILTNRMIRTHDQQPDVKWKEGWLTLHDEVTTLAPMKENEKAWAKLLEKMFTFGSNNTQYASLAGERIYPNLAECTLDMIERTEDEQEKKKILGCLEESKLRLEKGRRIVENSDQQLIIDPINTLQQGKAIFDMLYWEGTNSRPESSLRSFAQFLYEWYLQNGEHSMLTLLNELDELMSFREKFAKLLIGEILIPWEMDAFIKNTENSKQLFIHWENKRQLLNILNKWYADERKKVAT